MLYETKFLISLLLTVIIELPIVYIFSRWIFKIKNLDVRKILFVGFLASTLTLPYLWFVLSPFISSNYYILYGELFVMLVESMIYNQLLKLRMDRAIMLSIIANLVSFLVGLLII